MGMFSAESLYNLQSCNKQLFDLFSRVVTDYDCTIIQGYRDKNTQDEYFRIGASKVIWPKSKHNHWPSNAVDVAPYFSKKPHIRWGNTKSFYHFAEFVMSTADSMSIKITWGGDWNNNKIDDQSFYDLVHYQLR